MIRRRELSVAAAIATLFIVLAIAAPQYFTRANLTDIFLTNVPVLLVALGMTLVILTGEIDISVGSFFAVSSVACGVIAKAGAPALVAVFAACICGLLMGTLNGILLTRLRVPSIVATLAAMIAWRDILRWATQGAWIEDLPANFQWMGLSQASYPAVILLLAGAFTIAAAWGLRNLSLGRAIYATGSNAEAARLAGIQVPEIKCFVFALLGALTGLAAALNSVRFNQIPSNTGLGLEMKVIAAVVVGGTAVTGGSGTILGTLLGVMLLGAVGPALTFFGTNAYWEKAIQGGIILAAIVIDALRPHSPRTGKTGKHAGRDIAPAQA